MERKNVTKNVTKTKQNKNPSWKLLTNCIILAGVIIFVGMTLAYACPQYDSCMQCKQNSLGKCWYPDRYGYKYPGRHIPMNFDLGETFLTRDVICIIPAFMLMLGYVPFAFLYTVCLPLIVPYYIYQYFVVLFA